MLFDGRDLLDSLSFCFVRRFRNIRVDIILLRFIPLFLLWLILYFLLLTLLFHWASRFLIFDF